MKARKIEIDYQVFSSIEELNPQDRCLAEKAIAAQKGSYAPYSRFNVGAAVLLDDGSVFTGANQENAASPSGICAERTAMFAAGATRPGVAMIGIAIAGGPDFSICDEPATPCGGCRQVMAEYQRIGQKPLAIIMVGAKEIWKFSKVEDLLPMIFNSLDK